MIPILEVAPLPVADPVPIPDPLCSKPVLLLLVTFAFSIVRLPMLEFELERAVPVPIPDAL
jgi:hypothetical protein